MEFYLSDILDIVIEYIHRNRRKSKLVDSFYLPIISFIKIIKKYYRFDFCKKHIAIQYSFDKNDISNIVNNYIISLNNHSIPLSVSFDTETFIKILELLLNLCKDLINKIKDDIETSEEIKKYYNELVLWVQSDCFSVLENKNPQICF